MSKVIIKKEDEIVTLLDEKDINGKIRVCYMFLRNNKLILHDTSDVSATENMDLLQDGDIVLFMAIRGISHYGGPLYYADETTLINFNFSYTGSASGANSSLGLLFQSGGTWNSVTIVGYLPSDELYESWNLSNLNLNGATQRQVNRRVDSMFGDVLSIINGTSYNGDNDGE